MLSLICICLTFLLGVSRPEKPHFLSDEFIDSINKAQTRWRAGKNWPSNATGEFFRGLGGVIDESKDYRDEILREFRPEVYEIKNIPESFDASKKWPHCESSINSVKKQGNCGSCWAVQTAATITDRLCISTNASVRFEFSAEDILTCCPGCFEEDNGCNGGRITVAWRVWVKSGFVSGGGYNSQEGCKPYSKSAYEDHKASKCIEYCVNGRYGKSYFDDKKFGKKVYMLYSRNMTDIQAEIMLNGPVETGLKIYQDFLSYTDGVYFHVRGEFTKEVHAIKLIGWGVENGTPYWLAVNSWGKKWGKLGGFVKILRGSNECEIEQFIVAGLPSHSSAIQYSVNYIYFLNLFVMYTCFP